MLIDLDSPGDGVKVMRFPDSQPHVNVAGLAERRGEVVDVRCGVTSPGKLLLLLEAANAVERHGCRKGVLKIPYLLAARYDRVMVSGDSLDVEVVASLVNLAGFAEVELFDVHSDVATALIRRARNVSNECVVRAIEGREMRLVIPDAGAAKKAAMYQKWNPNITGTIECRKSRNLATGRIALEVLNPEEAKGKHCVIIDDICDGGATFVQIAKQIQPGRLTLAVSHGIFSKGLTPFVGKFSEIVTTTSFPTQADLKNPPGGLEVKVVPHPL